MSVRSQQRKNSEMTDCGLYSLQLQFSIFTPEKNIGTQSVQELFFVIGAFVELFIVMILFKFFGCDVQQEKNCT